MPPANSPAAASPAGSRTPTRTPSPSTYLPALRELGSPVLDLASTLSFQAEDDVDADNVNFLRTPPDVDDGISVEALAREIRNERRRREVQRREAGASDEYRRMYGLDPSNPRHPRQQRLGSQTRSPYGDRVPSTQSLYDWAPVTEDGDEETLENILSVLREQQPNTHPEILRVLGRSQLETERDSRRSNPSSRFSTTGSAAPPYEPSLRSAAILQSVRRNHRFSARSRDLMQRYVLDRERVMHDGDERDRTSQSRWSRPPPNPNEGSRYEYNRLAWQASQRPGDNTLHSQRDTLDALRRRYLENPSNNKPTEFEKIIKYLYMLRSVDSEPEKSRHPSHPLEESQRRSELDQELTQKMHGVVPPPPTSWLAPGTVFSGFQQATNPIPSSSATLYRLANNQPMTSSTIDPPASRVSSYEPPRIWLNRSLTATPTQVSPAPSHAAPESQPQPPPDRWTVRVSIHAVDYENMTLQGTMEAFNVPSVSGGVLGVPTKTTFSTYLEGELIDFKQHTLLTEPDRPTGNGGVKVKTTPDIDAAYWRRLEPFASLSDKEIAHALLDASWIDEMLMGKYVLMRWKERCFVKPITTPNTSNMRASNDTATSPPASGTANGAAAGASPPNGTVVADDGNGYGLSISGFYYVSLRRSDGRCEGLYFDPQSSPYQHLELNPSAGGKWGMSSWEFR